MKEQNIEDLIRKADQGATAPISDSLWQRVEAGLDANLTSAHAPVEALAAKPISNLRVVRQANQVRFRRLLAIAASLLALLGVGWWLSAPQAKVESEQLLSSSNDIDLDRSTLEGPLEIDGDVQPGVSRSIYEGVIVKNGEMSVSTLRVCSPC